VFAFAVCFMNLVSTSVLGVFFYNLYFAPIILTHSPHFKSVYKQNKILYWILIVSTFLFGVNFIRIITSRVFGTLSTTNQLNNQYFYQKPLNNMANFTLIYTVLQAILCAVCLYLFILGQDAWSQAALGIIINLTLVIFQLVKCCQTL
jgi:hypothetical protein